jgi:hypothetical protein
MVEISGTQLEINMKWFTIRLNRRNKHKMMKEQVGDYSQFLKMRKTRKAGRNHSSKIVVG